MHPLLISQIAQDEIAQRIRSTERERLARQASRAATPAGLPRPGARSDSQRLVHRWLAQRPAWRKASPRMDTTAAETCPDGDGS